MPYTIGIDASRAVKNKRTGTENYSWFLLRELLKFDTKNHYQLYAPHLPGNDFGDFPNTQWLILPPQRLWSQIALAKAVNQQKPDVLFVPSHVVPLMAKIKSVVTLHDVAYRYFPRSYSPMACRYLNFSTSSSAAKAKAILVPSQSTRQDLEKFYKTDDQKITVTPLGYDSSIYNTDHKINSSSESKPYIYFVGRLEERKNVLLLIEAFALLAKGNPTAHLYLAGKPGYGYERIKQRLNSFPSAIRSRIAELGYIDDQQSASYLGQAALFAFPSRYEGFGIPVLEAMASGTPVVCSNSSSLPEVAETATVLLKPEDPSSWALAINNILTDPKKQQELREKGIDQAKKFSWQKTAQQTLEVLENVAKQ